MKLMHISDLHIGKVLMEHSLIEDQKYILKRIIEIIKNEKVEGLLIAGDIYDKNIPSIEAIDLFDTFLTELQELEIKVFIISGNHDSNDRLSFGSKIFSNLNINIESIYKGELKKYTLNDNYGNLNIYLLPFIKPINVRKYTELKINTYNDAVKYIIDNTNINKEERNIILVHQFVTGMGVNIEYSDSETLLIGGLDNIDYKLFDDFDYVALGHIHGPQKVGRETIRYSGTPLKYSFSEVNHHKSAVIIDFKHTLEYKLVPLEPLRQMEIIEGNYNDLLKCEKNYNYIEVILKDEHEILNPIENLRKVFPNILKLNYHNSRSELNTESKYMASGNIKEKTELELFNEFYQLQNNVPLNKEEQDIIINIIEEAKNETN